MEFLWAIFIGISAGVFSGLFGIGGGVIIVPLLMFAYKFPQQVATATSLTALLLPTGALAIWKYYSEGHLNLTTIKIGFIISAAMFIGGFFGAKIATSLQSGTLTRMFSIFLLLMALRLWITAE